MKVKIVKPREYWISPYTFLKKITFNVYHPSDKIIDKLEPVSLLIQKVCKFLGPKDKIVIHGHDLWNLDHTLAKIILPSLKFLKDNKGGSPWVDDEDVPEEIRSTQDSTPRNAWDIDEFFHDRWNYIIEEMIFAFESILSDKIEFVLLKEDEDRDRVKNGLKLFGKYYHCLWN